MDIWQHRKWNIYVLYQFCFNLTKNFNDIRTWLKFVSWYLKINTGMKPYETGETVVTL